MDKPSDLRGPTIAELVKGGFLAEFQMLGRGLRTPASERIPPKFPAIEEWTIGRRK